MRSNSDQNCISKYTCNKYYILGQRKGNCARIMTLPRVKCQLLPPHLITNILHPFNKYPSPYISARLATRLYVQNVR